MSDHPNFLLITTYLPVMYIVSRSVALTLSVYCFWIFLHSINGLIAYVMTFVFIDKHIFEDSPLDNFAGWLHGAAFALIVTIPRVQTTENVNSIYNITILDVVWCCSVLATVWCNKESNKAPKKTARVFHSACFFCCVICLVLKLSCTEMGKQFVDSISEFLFRTLMYYTLLSFIFFAWHDANGNEGHSLLFWTVTNIFFCNIYVVIFCFIMTVMCTWWILEHHKTEKQTSTIVPTLPLQSIVKTSKPKTSPPPQAPDPELALAKQSTKANTPIMQTIHHDQVKQASEMHDESLADAQAELRQLLRNKNN